jgi:poly(3-hydroxybutyrate) depolymerase
MRPLATWLVTITLLACPTATTAAASSEPVERTPVPSAGCGTTTAERGSATGQAIVVDGSTREYALHVPAAYDDVTPAPLWIQLHGVDGTGAEQVEMLSDAADEHGFVVAGPQSSGYSPEYDDFPVAQAMAQAPIPERVANVALRNGCSAEPTVEPIDAMFERWSWDCPPGAEVELLVHPFGHSWMPGTTDHVWAFFEQHPMPE